MTVHSWMPNSPCEHECIDPGCGQAGLATAAIRALCLAGLAVTLPVAATMSPPARRDETLRIYARNALRCFGIDVRLVDSRARSGLGYAKPGSGVLVVAGHVGWTDVLVLAAVQPVSFVARADLIDWPLLGRLARTMRVIPIDRARLRQLPAAVAAVRNRLIAGERVAAFPEGTTWCGRAYGQLQPAMFQAAIDAGVPVQPVRLRYLSETGVLTTEPGFVGSESLAASMRRLLRARRITAEVMLAPVLEPGSCRRELADRCIAAIRGQVRFDFTTHGRGAAPIESPGYRSRSLERAS